MLGSLRNEGGPMLHLEINVKRRHIYALVAAVALIVTILPVASWASHQFNDVPDSNIFHDDIAWLADAGVTLGCNPPANDEFCPSDTVLRETMAAFLRRLAENQVVDAKTAITAEDADDADMLDGKDSTAFLGKTEEAADSALLEGMTTAEIVPAMWAQNDGGAFGESVADTVEVNSISMTVPSNGHLTISGFIFINPSTDGSFSLNALLDGTIVGPSGIAWNTLDTSDGDNFTISYTITVPVTAGAHTLTQEIDGTSAYFKNRESLTAVFYPSASFGTTAAVAGGKASQSGD